MGFPGVSLAQDHALVVPSSGRSRVVRHGTAAKEGGVGGIAAATGAAADRKKPIDPAAGMGVLATNAVTSPTQYSHGARGNTTVYVREHLVVTTPEGHILHFTVDGSVVRYGARIPTDPVVGAVTCLAWKGDWIVTGDTAGSLHLWDLKAKVSRSILTHHGAAKQLIFDGVHGSTRFLALFDDGVDVWDASKADLVSLRQDNKSAAKDRALEVSVGWTHSGRPVLAFANGTIQVMDMWLSTAVSPLSQYSYARPLLVLAASDRKTVERNKSVLQIRGVADAEGPPDSIGALPKQTLSSPLPPFYEAAYQSCTTIMDRCLLTAKMFGDVFEYKFWTLFKYYHVAHKDAKLVDVDVDDAAVDLRQASGMVTPDLPGLPSPPDLRSIVKDLTANGAADADEVDGRLAAAPGAAGLPSSFDLLSDAGAIRAVQLQRLKVRRSQRGASNSDRQTSSRDHVMLGKPAEATRILLETDTKEDTFHVDALRACVISAISAPDTCRNTIKLVAMNLIVSGKLDSGVELLCLVGCHLDACHYLQSEGQWERAAYLGKATLHPAAYTEVLSRWVNHLYSQDRPDEAILVAVSNGQWKKALVLLNSVNWPSLTFLFTEACFEQGLLHRTESESSFDRGAALNAKGPLLQTVWKQATEWASTVGNIELAKHYRSMYEAREEEIAKAHKLIEEDEERKRLGLPPEREVTEM